MQLAASAQLSHPFLSQLERGLARPSMVSLERIARALGSSQVELLGAIDDGDPASVDQPPVVLVRASDGSRGTYGQAEARLLVHGNRAFHPMEMQGDNRDAGDYFSHQEDEFLHVIEGTCAVDLASEGTFVLTAGDSLYFGGGTPHRWSAVDGGGYRLFVVKQNTVAS